MSITPQLRWDDHMDGQDWPALSAFYAEAGMGHKPPEALHTVFDHSLFKCRVWDGERLVAVGRVLADGADCAYLCDIAVAPSHQGLGLGKAVVTRLLALCQGHKKIILYAMPGKEGFYRRLSFLPMATAMAIFSDPEAAQARGLLRP